MSNGEIIREIHDIMERDDMKVAAYRNIMLKAVAGILDTQASMDDKLKAVCMLSELHTKDIERLKKRDNLNNMLTAAMATVAGVLGFKN